MNQGLRTEGLGATAPRTPSTGIGLRRAGWLLLALSCLAIAWRVQRSVQATLGPTNHPTEASATIRGKTTLRYAKRFSVEYRKDCKVVRVIEPSDNASIAQYQLVPRGSNASPIDSKTMVIETPVRRAIALSTTYVTAFTRLGVPGRLVGMAGVPLLNTPELIEQARRGQLEEVGDGTTSMAPHLDLERIRMLSPDLVISSYMGSSVTKLYEAGLKVIENSEWLESTPLGRAEWIKFVAAFLDLEPEAERWFSELEQRYEAIAARARNVSTRPTVLCGMDHRGTWYVPGGDGHMAKLIADAGGEYLWRSERSTAVLPLKMEAVLARAQHAEIWFLHTSTIRSSKEMVEADPRYGLFDALRTNRLYNNDARLSAGGGNDFWENGVANPDRILAELVAIIHPELAPGNALHWYRRVPEVTPP